MSRRAILAIGLLTLPLTACLTPARDFHGYVADDAQPRDIKPDEDTRSSVLAQLGSPSTESVFDDKTWMYISDVQERVAFLKPKITKRSITAIRFGEDDKVDEVLEYNAEDGEVINWAFGNRSSARLAAYACRTRTRRPPATRPAAASSAGPIPNETSPGTPVPGLFRWCPGRFGRAVRP